MAKISRIKQNISKRKAIGFIIDEEGII